MSHSDQAPDDSAVRRRDRGLRRVGKATRWAAASATVAFVALGAGYAHALPGMSSAFASSAVRPATASPCPRPGAPTSAAVSSPSADPAGAPASPQAPTRTPPVPPIPSHSAYRAS